MWRMSPRTLSGPRRFAFRSLRILVLSLREFITDGCVLRASALTFYSLLSIVPVFAMAFGVAKGFGVDKILREKVLENMQGQEEVISRVMEFSENLLQNTKGGIIAGIGLMILFWTVIQVLGNIERSFNHIWGIKKNRSWGQKFTDYLALMLIAPVFFIVASSATVFIVSQVQLITEKITMLGPVGPVILTLLKVLPYAVFWWLLTFLYMFLPNGRIPFSSALLGGGVAGTIYQIVQRAYIHFQIGASNYGAVYGTFAALPLFLIWLQISWFIVLYGAELAFAHQNEERFEFEQDCLNASERLKKLLCLRLCQICVTRFSAAMEPPSAEDLAAIVQIPIRLTRDLLTRMAQAGLLNLVQGHDERMRRYQPARDISDLTVAYVLERLENAGSEDIPVAETSELIKLRGSLIAFEDAVRVLPQNVLLRDLNLPASRILSR